MIVLDQHCTFLQAKKLKELGINQNDSMYYFSRKENLEPSFMLSPGSKEIGYAAFNVAELGQLLPGNLLQENDSYGLVLVQTFPDGKEQECYMITYNEVSNDFDTLGSIYEATGKTEAESRANLLIFLIENQLISLS